MSFLFAYNLAQRHFECLLTGHRSLQVIVIGIRKVMRDDNVRLTLSDGRLDVLLQLQVRHRVHLDVLECAFKLSTDAQEIRCHIQVIIKFLVLGTKTLALAYYFLSSGANVLAVKVPIGRKIKESKSYFIH